MSFLFFYIDCEEEVELEIQLFLLFCSNIGRKWQFKRELIIFSWVMFDVKE